MSHPKTTMMRPKHAHTRGYSKMPKSGKPKTPCEVPTARTAAWRQHQTHSRPRKRPATTLQAIHSPHQGGHNFTPLHDCNTYPFSCRELIAPHRSFLAESAHRRPPKTSACPDIRPRPTWPKASAAPETLRFPNLARECEKRDQQARPPHESDSAAPRRPVEASFAIWLS